MVLYYDGKAHMIELKTDKGKQSEHQIKWQKKIEEAGFSYVIIRSLEDFQKYFSTILF